MKLLNLILFAVGLVFSLPVLSAGETPPFKVVSGCQASDYVFAESPAAIEISGFKFIPKCLKVKAGATVTLSANLSHPSQGIQSSDGPENPFFHPSGEVTSDVTVVLEKLGIFGYFCVNHGSSSGAGMAGAVLVE
ncbi:MAG: hypothetical protein AABZ55_15510 [Bdellovibrionota bacterium]